MSNFMMGSKLNTKLQCNEDINISTLSGMVPINENTWLIDSGASRHMTDISNHLTHFIEKETHLHVVLGDDARYNVRGVGTSTFQLDSDMQLKLEEVLYVPGMKRNLVSISALEDKGYKITFSEGRVLAWHKDSHIISSKVIDIRDNSLYKLTIKPVQALLHDTISLSELWHRRLAHIHYRALPSLRKMVTGLPEIQIQHEGVCKGCALGKNVKGSFPSSDNRSKEILDLIHSDVCGPMTVASLNGYLYYVLFIDDHSRKTWIYFLKNKDGVLAKFQEFKAQVENLTRRKIKVLRSDNGGEYTSKEFINFCIEAGIKRELTVSYNPQQNGVVERKNRTIIEATKAMIHDQSLPMTLWAEACMTAVYVQNRSPHQILKNITPEEAFTKVKPEIGHFRIFGCPVYLHVPKEKRSKLEPSGRKGTFVGYSESSKAYRIYILGQRQIEVSRDVTFEEEVAFQKSREAQMEIDGETIPPPHSEIQREIDSVPDEPTTQIDPAPLADSVAPSNVPRDITIGHKRPTWACQTLEEAERHKAPQGAIRESKRPKRFSSYLSAMTHIIDSEPTCHGEASGEQVWQDAMTEEYQSILKNDVWDVVPRPEGKSVVTSKWIYKIKHAVDGSIEKYKARFMARGFSQIEGVDYDKTFRTSSQIYLHSIHHCSSCFHGLEATSDGCKDNFSQW
jgi:hypothetical protein